MRRAGLLVLTALIVAVPVAVSCGGGDGASDADQTLPPIATTTSSTILITTTTAWVPVTYVIQRGDSLRSIADQFQTSLDKLAILNGITNRNDIKAGEVLDIPPPTVPAGAATSSTTSTT
jgi:LysM repeat protein